MSSKLTLQSTLTMNNGRKIPHLGFGVYNAFGNEAYESVTTALNTGYRLIDSAQLYENEKEVGFAIKEWLKNNKKPRSEVFYTTKIWDSDQGYQNAKASIEQSLNECGLDHIDLFLIHSPYPGKKKRLETWKALEEAVEEGKIHSIGVSNFGIKHLKELLEVAKIKPVVNQLEIHPFLCRKEIVKFCQENDIVAEGFCPLTRGKRFGDKRVQALVKKYNKTPGQILIRWQLDRGIIPLPKSVTPSRIRENADVYDFHLTKEDIESLMTGEHYVIDWDPTTCE